jgi:hypothetical protein
MKVVWYSFAAAIEYSEVVVSECLVLGRGLQLMHAPLTSLLVTRPLPQPRTPALQQASIKVDPPIQIYVYTARVRPNLIELTPLCPLHRPLSFRPPKLHVDCGLTLWIAIPSSVISSKLSYRNKRVFEV